jgi:hypothetical protein
MEQPEKIELRSEKVRQIIGQIPPRIIRMGIASVFLVFVMLLMFATFIRFNYNIKAHGYLFGAPNTLKYELLVSASQSRFVVNGQPMVLFPQNQHYPFSRLETSVNATNTEFVLLKSGTFVKVSGSIYSPNTTLTDTLPLEANIVAPKTTIFEILARK